MGHIISYTRDIYVSDDTDEYLEGGEKDKKSPTKASEEVKLTPEEEEAKKAEKKEKDAKASAKAKELLYGYIRRFRVLMFFGFILNILGMVGEFVSPLFIGWVVDAIVVSDQE